MYNTENTAVPTALFNEILNTGQFQEDWSKSIITPVYKKRRKHNPNNSRAISVVSSISNFFMKIISVRLTN